MVAKELLTFENKKVRRVEYNGEWYFVVEDIVFILTQSLNVKDYIKKIRKRDSELQKGWGQIVTTLPLQTDGGKQKVNCANLEGCFRIIQSIPSSKAEPIKQWLARVGYERMQEVENPEIAQERMMEIYKQKGYDDEWIKRRIQTIRNRKELTNEWDIRGATEIDYAIFTAIMSKETFGLVPSDHKKIKGLKKENLRDHMTDIELALTNLGELAAKEIHKSKNTKGKINLANDVLEAGKIAGNTRKEIEKKTEKKVISKDNYLDLIKKIK